jgi:hypothetical protein
MDTNNAVTPADSASATDLNIPAGADYDKWRMTGEMPSEQTEESAPSEETSATTEEAVTEAESAPAPPQEKRETSPRTENRWAKLSRENRELRDRLAALETASEGRETQQEPPPAKVETKAEGPTIYDKNPDGSWKFKSHQEFQDAVRKWDRESLKAELKAETEQSVRQQEIERAERTISEGFVRRLEPTRAKYADFDSVAFSPDLLIPKGSVADLFLIDSDHAGEVLYYLGQHPEITKGFYGNYDLKTGRFANKELPTRQFRKLMEIEGQFSKVPAKRVTSAPPPPRETGGRGTTSADEVEQAVKDEDYRSYAAAANARDIARRKRK